MSPVASPSNLDRDLFAALDAQNHAALAALVTDDVRLRLGNAEAVVGKAALVDAAKALDGSIAGIRHNIKSVWAVDDVVIAELDVDYERLDGNRLTLPCCNVFHVRDGLVSDYRVYMDINPVFA
jgi:ketosteroid isomerase-like protein